MGKAWKQAERDVAKALQEWWSQVEPGCVFLRTPGSGAWATAHKLKGFKARGDITYDPATCSRWPWTVEVKFRKVVKYSSIENFKKKKTGPVAGYWKQCCGDAEKEETRPLLIFRGNRMPWHVVIAEEVMLLSTLLERNPLDL